MFAQLNGASGFALAVAVVIVCLFVGGMGAHYLMARIERNREIREDRRRMEIAAARREGARAVLRDQHRQQGRG